MRLIAITILLASIPAWASAEEKPLRLKQAPGANKVETYCGACHSVDYIMMNSPFLDAGKWDAEVTKMNRSALRTIQPTSRRSVII